MVMADEVGQIHGQYCKTLVRLIHNVFLCFTILLGTLIYGKREGKNIYFVS